MANETYALVCAGGGAHGAYQVGVLKYIHEKFSQNGKSPFRLFAGSSCGSLNTSFYAAQSYDAYNKRLQLEELWRGFHIPAYHGSMMRNAIFSIFRNWRKNPGTIPASWSLLSPKPMLNVLEHGFKVENLKKAFEEGTTQGIAVAATELISARTCWFLDGPAASSWNLFHSIGLKTNLHTNHLAASCSIPVFMPPVKIEDHYYLDGSVSLARPLSAAVSMGATRILSIGADKPFSQDLPRYHDKFKPKLSHVIRMMINQLTKDHAIDEAIQIEKLNQFYRSLNKKNKPGEGNGSGKGSLPIYHEKHQADDYRPVEICTFFPSRRIKRAPAFSTYESGPATKLKQTRFMFHEKFITELINLGYEDACSKHEELNQFFEPHQKTGKRWFIFAKK